MSVMKPRISIREVADLGHGNFRVRLAAGNADNEIVHSDIVTAATADAAVEKARSDFSRWLALVFGMVPRKPA